MLKKFLPKSEYSFNVLTLITGTAVAQAIPVAISPILSRMYTPADFGVLALYMSIVSIISVIATGRYELAIMLPQRDKDAINIVALSIILTFLISLISFVCFYVFNDSITRLFDNPQISNWLYVVPFTILLTGIFQSFSYWLNRNKSYKRLAKSEVLKSSSSSVTTIGVGLFNDGESGLILGRLIGQFITVFVLGKKIYYEETSLLKNIQKKKILKLAARYIDFPKIAALTGLLNVTSVRGPIIIMTSFFKISIIGFYSFSYTLLSLPVGLIGKSIGQVFFQEMSSKTELQDRVNIFEGTLTKLLLFSAPIFTIITIFGDVIFYFVFGKEWVVAGEYAQILGPWLFLVLIISPLTQLYNILEQQKVFLKLNVFSFVIRIVSLFIGGIIFKDILVTLYLFVASGVISWIVILWKMLSFLRIKKLHIFISIVKYYIAYLLMFYTVRLIIENIFGEMI